MVAGPRDSDPFALAWAFVGIAAALGVLACSARWRRAGAWLALALLGQTASLALYVAGPHVSYHHYRLEHSTWLTATIASVLAAQALLVGVGLVRHATELRAALQRALPGWRLLAGGALALAAAAKISRPAERSALEFALALALQLVALGNLALAVRALTPDALRGFGSGFERVLGPPSASPEPGGLDAFAWCTAGAACALAALLNVAVYERVPHVPDEVVYLLHARYFAAGRLWLDPPPVPAAFDLDLMLLDGDKWYCPVPPGWPAVLALGVRAGVPWLVNPLLGGASVLAAYALFRELGDRRGARMGSVLLAASPWFTFLNVSFMTHSLTLACTLLAALGVARSRRTGSVGWAALAGAAIGVVALVRPLDGMLLALALGVWSLGWGGARLRWAPLAALVACTALVGGLTLLYNAALTGDARNFPIQHYVDLVYGPGKNGMGFGPEKGLGWSGLDPWPGHSPAEALVTAQFNLFGLGAETFGWGMGSLVFVWVWLLGARWSRTDRALAAFALLIVGSSLFYWFNGGPDFGARYWYLAFVPCVWLSVSGLRALVERGFDVARVTSFAACAVLVASTTWIPWRAIDKYRGYRGVERIELEHSDQLRNALVLVVGARHPEYAAAALLGEFDWTGERPVVAWLRDLETLNALIERFPGRTIWLLEAGRTHGPVDLEQARLAARRSRAAAAADRAGDEDGTR